ncbi:MAG: GNAT family N-acetyltransferase [Coriobacteriia bacterium]|nr:GNAT family N-acetyltransferase [Coriobacteriia bacterium]
MSTQPAAHVTIKRAEEADLEQILEQQYVAYQSEAAFYHDFSIQPLTQTIEEVQAEYARGVILKACDDTGNIIGSVRAEPVRNGVYVGKLFVHPSWRKQGIGSMLLDAIESECPTHRYELMTANKSVWNIRLYERHGYKIYNEEYICDDYNYVYMEKLVEHPKGDA